MPTYTSIPSVFSGSVLMITLFLTGCDQIPHSNEPDQQNIEIKQSHHPAKTESGADNLAEDNNLSQGNLFNIAGDIARLQTQTNDYVSVLKQTQNQIDQAIQDKNPQQLQHGTNHLKQELQDLHTTLLSTSLKSQEVDQIRQNLIAANQQILNMPLFQGQLDLGKMDFEKIEKQLNHLQLDIMQLATLVLGHSTATENPAS